MRATAADANHDPSGERPPRSADILVIGAGHNGLVAATLLARAGLAVAVVEARDAIGGACRTERPFPQVPALAASTGAYLLGLFPPELLRVLDVELPLVRRDPHYFLPTPDDRPLLLGADPDANRRALTDLFGPADAAADARLAAELAALRADLAPSWLADPLAVEETAQRYVRPVLRDRYVRLVRGGALDYLREFGFESELLLAMYAVTDALPGLAGGPNSPGSGHNLLVHNMARLPGSGGTWMVVRGGMGTVTRTIAAAARRAGARITLSAPVESIIVDAGVARGAVLENGVEIRARAVLAATDPHVLQRLVPLPAALRARIDSWLRLPGRTLKVNLALNGLPAFRALPEARGQHGTTVHLLPRHARDGVLRAVDEACADAAAGRLPDAPPLEWYLHSTLDPSLQDAAGHHSSALFVQGVPNEVAGSSWAAERDGYVEHLLRLVDEYAPGTSDLVVDVAALAPPDIAAHFGITTGHIFHVDNSVATIDRMPYATGVDGVYAGSAACHPAGSVIGAAGHNAARRILADLGVARRDVAHAGRHATNLDLPG